MLPTVFVRQQTHDGTLRTHKLLQTSLFSNNLPTIINIILFLITMGNKSRNSFDGHGNSKYSKCKKKKFNPFMMAVYKKHQDEVDQLTAQIQQQHQDFEIQIDGKKEEVQQSSLIITELNSTIRELNKKRKEEKSDYDLQQSKMQKLVERNEKHQQTNKKTVRKNRDLIKSLDKAKNRKSVVEKELKVEKKKTLLSLINSIDPEELVNKMETIGYSREKIELNRTRMSTNAFNQYIFLAGGNALMHEQLTKLNRRTPRRMHVFHKNFIQQSIDTLDINQYREIVDDLIKRDAKLITVGFLFYFI